MDIHEQLITTAQQGNLKQVIVCGKRCRPQKMEQPSVQTDVNMKTKRIQKEHCARYPLKYITASIKEHGVEIHWNSGVEEYNEEEKIFWLALRDNVDNDNCFAFALHNWASIIKADPQWSPNTTQLWDSVVDVCNGGFPGRSPHYHLQLLKECLPFMTQVHQQPFKEAVFNTWSSVQWEQFFEYIRGCGAPLQTMMKIFEDVSNFTDHDVCPYISDLALSWIAYHDTQFVIPFAQTQIGKRSLQYIENNLSLALPYLLDTCGAFGETPDKAHKSVYILNQYIPLQLDETTKKCIAHSFLCWSGSVCREKNDHATQQERQWVKDVWNTLPHSTHIDVYKKQMKGYWWMAVRGVEKMMGWGFDVTHLCHTIDADFGEELDGKKYPNIAAYLQSQRIQLELPTVEHEKLRKL